MSLSSRREFLRRSAAVGALSALPASSALARSVAPPEAPRVPLAQAVIATWDNRAAAEAAWNRLTAGEGALDAAEQGVWIPEADPSDTSVGLGGRPDRDGKVTLDACVMDHQHRCGAVAALQDILHPVSVARRVMEATPHVMLVGDGAREFALQQGFEPTDLLTDASRRAWEAWRETPEAQVRPPINVERRRPVSADDHDTIGLLALDRRARLAGACTTSGWGYKLPGRVGDSPIIGAGLYVDGSVGAATATGHGEEMIRIAAAHSVVEAMRFGLSPEAACQSAVERLARVTPSDTREIQAGFLALTPDGASGAWALQPGFVYVVTLPEGAPEPAGGIRARTPVVGGVTYTIEAPALLG
ncbi:N(4)-(beta-N-acetylglucosaminyl)-L-asparaginase [Rubricoccus marinus]|uniref:N(4)-(Beta-N-acetylglucosaminyl)-L-asparaginase n=1 Tax=Rubricoccus marinus TaxID=716817 RepID=A0A259U388_9BACT|nr:N(4)-(beta-N-acetylglucosaminyl)-L-asparaginase [Rubricoccus marinus]OZC04274.1 hypothetical protein BSZ36_15555 [Rubricoccus marinus]